MPKTYVDHSLTGQASVLRFVEDTFLNGERVGGSFDAVAGSLSGLFDFAHPDPMPYLLDKAGKVLTRE